MELHEDVFVICPERIPRHDALSFWRGEGIRGKYLGRDHLYLEIFFGETSSMIWLGKL